MKRRWRRPFLALVAWAVLAVVSLQPGVRLFDAHSYDWLSTLWPPRVDHTPVVVVGIDEPSFAELGLQWPWPRQLHARLIDSLKAAGAAVIVFDVVFAEPSTADADAALSKAIGHAGNVILAADEALQETRYVQQVSRIDPLPRFLDAGARSALATVTLDGDGVLRQLPRRPDDLALSALHLWQRTNHLPPTPAPTGPRLMQYFAPTHGYPYASYYQALRPGKFLPKDFFRNRIVIIGRDVKSAPDPGARQADAFATSYTLTTDTLTSGAEVHATALDDLRLGLAVRPIGRSWQLALLLAVTLAAFTGFRRWRPITSTLSALLGGAVLLAADYLLLREARIWLPPTPLLAGLAAGYLGNGILAFIEERLGRQRIRRAFAQYLAPEVVDRLAADPAQLKLGGETRTMTVMFCDVRGFTTLSERFRDDPAGLTQLINRLFTAMTRVLLSHQGTIDKYIGDSIMAFWNAPVGDAEHPRHACEAALAMIETVRTFSIGDAPADGEPIRLAVGVGLNSGPCVVGNLGSEQRFNYTVLGDTVNLASRLEGQTKRYGIPIVIGPETAAAVADMALLELDLIAVKGKREAVRIFGLLGDSARAQEATFQALKTHHAGLLAHYRACDWDSATEALMACRAAAPELATLYQVYAERIDRFRQTPPPADWDGVYVATEK